jgi:hypothetical protein
MLLRLETYRTGIGQIVRSAGLLHENMLGASHRGVDQPIHVRDSRIQLAQVNQGL